MKTMIVALTLLVSTVALAEYQPALQWVGKTLNGQKETTLAGINQNRTPDQPLGCVLSLTDIGGGDYYVTVGQGISKFSDYIGVQASHSKTNASSTELNFVAGEGWGNDSTKNSIRIELDTDGSPKRAVGVAVFSINGKDTPKTIDCQME